MIGVVVASALMTVVLCDFQDVYASNKTKCSFELGELVMFTCQSGIEIFELDQLDSADFEPSTGLELSIESEFVQNPHVNN